MNDETTQHKRSTVYVTRWTDGDFGRHSEAFKSREQALRMADMMESRGRTDIVVMQVDTVEQLTVTEIERAKKHGG